MIIAEERYGSSTENVKVIATQNAIVTLRENVQEWSSVWSLTKSVFLPKGYPESVSQDYIQYQLWDSIQAFCSSITGCLSTQAILKGSGVGDASATAIAATITWIMKDGCGHIGRILFAWYKGTELDSNSKKWRLFADILNDFAIFLELLSPSFPGCFTVMVCTSTVMKSVVGVAGGATRAALTQHQARRMNLADVSAKDGSQETLVNLSALICSLILLPVLLGKTLLTWTLFFVFTFLHIIANYLAITALQMETLNFERYKLLVDHYFHSNGEVLSVLAANQKENVWVNIWPKNVTVKLGCTLSKTITTFQEFNFLIDIYSGNNYLLKVDNFSKNKKRICIVLHQNSTGHTQLKAAFQAFMLQYVFSRKSKQLSKDNLLKELLEVSDDKVEKMLCISTDLTNKLFELFLARLREYGWKTSFNLLGADEWRAKWNNPSMNGQITK